MRKLGGTAVVLAALLLTGCAAGSQPSEGAAVDSAPMASAAPITMAPEETASAAPTDNPYGDQASQESTYLDSVKLGWQGDLPSDDDLIGAGKLACEQIAGGADAAAVLVVTGGDPTNNVRVVGQALGIFCPELY